MTTHDSTAAALEAALHTNLILKLSAIARDQGATPAAAADIAGRLAAQGAEVRPDGRVRLSTGEPIAAAVENLRAELPAYFEPPAAPAAPEPKVPTTTAGRRRRASDRLAQANSDPAPRLNGGAE